jgi:hypothetical protein
MKTLTKRILGWILVALVIVVFLATAYFLGFFMEMILIVLVTSFSVGILLFIIWLLTSD